MVVTLSWESLHIYMQRDPSLLEKLTYVSHMLSTKSEGGLYNAFLDFVYEIKLYNVALEEISDLGD